MVAAPSGHANRKNVPSLIAGITGNGYKDLGPSAWGAWGWGPAVTCDLEALDRVA